MPSSLPEPPTAMRRELRRQRPSTVRAFALGVVAAVLAVLVVPFWLLWDWDANTRSRAFVATPQFVLWLLLFAAQAALWVGAAWLVISTLRHRVRDLRRRGALTKGTVAAIVGSTVVLAVAPIVLIIGARLGFFFNFRPGYSPRAHGSSRPRLGTSRLVGVAARTP
jgi:hypothetical protein